MTEKKSIIGHLDHGEGRIVLALADPRSPDEFAAAERLEALGLGTLNADGTITLNEKGEAALGEFTDAVVVELAALEAEADQ